MANRRYGESETVPSQTRRGKSRMRRSCTVARRKSAAAPASESATALSGVAFVSTAEAKCVSRDTCMINRRGRFWEVRDRTGELVCLTVYKRGAQEVVRRLCV